jgi:hypothetical protein
MILAELAEDCSRKRYRARTMPVVIDGGYAIFELPPHPALSPGGVEDR